MLFPVNMEFNIQDEKNFILLLEKENNRLASYAEKTRQVMTFYLGADYHNSPDYYTGYASAEYAIKDAFRLMDDMLAKHKEPYDWEWFFNFVQAMLLLPHNEAALTKGYNGKNIKLEDEPQT